MYKKIVFSLFALLCMALTASAADKRFKLVIDAGHGGRDTGAPGATSKEKNLTLRYALAFGAHVEKNCPDVQVIYTRRTDVFLALHERAEIANKNKADLFISIHINALENNHVARGFQSYTLGRGQQTGEKGIKENVEVAKRENSVIYLEKDYKKAYTDFEESAESDIMFEFVADKNRERSVELSRMMQIEVCKATGRVNGGSHQNNLAVLRLTSMPAVLLELGFISTPEEEKFLNSEAALGQYVKGFYNAFMAYKRKYGAGVAVPYRADSPEPVAKTTTPTTTKPSQPEPQAQPAQKPQPTQKPQPVQTTQKQQPTQPAQKPAATQKQQPTQTAQKPAQPAQQPAAAQKQQPAQPVQQPKQAQAGQPVFKVQLFVSQRVLRSGDSHFQGLDGCEYYEDGNYKKYTYGSSTNYNEIYRLRKQLAEKFPDSFIVAFKDGKKMDINEGIREFKANKK